MFFDFYFTLWVTLSPNKHILVKIRLEKVDLGEVYIQKEQENFKKRSSFNTIRGSIAYESPPACLLLKRNETRLTKLFICTMLGKADFLTNADFVCF